MFEAIELGINVTKKVFESEEQALHTQLLELQRKLRQADFPVIIIISGVEGAGKGAVVNRLNAWLDTRGVTTHAFWEESDEERDRPYFWRFWRGMPAKGRVAIMFGSWYTRPIIDHVYSKTTAAQYQNQLQRIAEFEQMLYDDGALLLKFWFHLSKKDQLKQLERDQSDHRFSPVLKKFSKKYNRFSQISEAAILATDRAPNPWHVIEAVHPRYRDLQVGTLLLDALTQRLSKTSSVNPKPTRKRKAKSQALPSVLDQVDLEQCISDSDYKRLLKKYQSKLYDLVWQAKQKKRSLIAVFEGWDAAGKGGAIRRLTAGMDARLFQVISVAAPSDEEKAQHYLWRFWRHLPRSGYVTIYDRSWYGRVLVERVEKFAQVDEWQRAYQEMNAFEQQLHEHGTILCKFWLHLSPEEQLRRFEARQKTPWKQHKITEEDWRNRERWDDYILAINDMVARTSTQNAPWTLIAANDKKVARIQVLSHILQVLKRSLSNT